jgi:hypothetical protein
MNMELQSVLFLLGIFLLVAAFVARPFTQSRRLTRINDQTRSGLLAERERLLAILRELDFDYSLGKVPEEDYPVQRAELLQLGAEAMKKLDSQSAPPAPEAVPPSTKRAAPTTDDEIEDLISKRRSSRREKTGGFCPECGKAILLSDRFCPSCGKTLE